MTGAAGVPARCDREQIAAVERRVSHLPGVQQRATIVGAEARYLGYPRYLDLHAEGICATVLPAHAATLQRDDLGCATPADFAGRGLLADASAYLGSHIGVFWTVVPDGVATVTISFSDPNGRAPMTTTVRPVSNVVVARRPQDALNQIPSTIVLRRGDGHLLKKIAVTSTNMPTIGYGC